MIASLLAAAVVVAAPNQIISPMPTVSLSAIRSIKCQEGVGSGFIIGKDIVATALHVASLTNCHDAETGKGLVIYKKDVVHDFALMTGKLPDVIPIKYSCLGYITGNRYSSYGITPWHYTSPVFGQYSLVAQDDYSSDGFVVDGNKKMPGMRHLKGYIVPGNSGGPVIDSEGYAQGINNVSVRGMLGMSVINDGYSYEIKNTFLCKP